MFGHRSLAPILDLQDQLRERSASPSGCRTSSRAPVQCCSSSRRSPATSHSWSSMWRPRVATPSRVRIVEIGAVKVAKGKIEDRWSTLVNPGEAIVGKQLHGITDADVKGAPAPAQAAGQLMDWAGDALLVGHNVGFDIGFIEAALGDGRRIERGRYLDTLVLARDAYPDSDMKLERPGALLRARDRAQSPRPPGRRGHGAAAAALGQRPARAHRQLQARRGRRDSRAAERRHHGRNKQRH